MRKSWYGAGTVLCCLLWASNPLAAQTTVQFNLTGVGEAKGIASNAPQLGGSYTDPYYGNINSGPTIPVICDDFVDNSFIPESWTAYVTSLSSITSESSINKTVNYTAYWNGTAPVSSPLTTTAPSSPTSQIDTYEAAALLSIDILNSSGTPQELYTYALWELTNPSQPCSYLPGGCSTSPSSDQYQVASLVAAAVQDVTNNSINGKTVASYLSNYNITIYDYKGNCSGTCTTLPPQEMMTVNTAEPPSPALLGLDLLGVAGLILFCRRRFGAVS